MANIKSSKKRILISEQARKTNSHFKSRMKTLLKKAFLAIEEKATNAEQLVRGVLRTIDQTSAKGIIHKNAAARHKSRLASAFNTGVIPTNIKEKIAQGNTKKSTTKSRAASKGKETTATDKKSTSTTKAASDDTAVASEATEKKPTAAKKAAAPKKKATPKKDAAVAKKTAA